MKHFTLTSRTLLGLALMGAFAVAPTLTSRAEAQTQPELQTRLADAGDRFDDNDATDNDNDGPRNRRDHDGRGPNARERGDRDDRSSRERDDRGRDDRGRDGRGRDFGARQNTGRDFGGRGGRSGDFGGRENRDGNRLGRGGNVAPIVAPKFVGVVTSVRNNSEFDVRIDNKTYNVYLSAPSAPVRVGQTVNLDGERIGNNDIRSASLLQPRRR